MSQPSVRQLLILRHAKSDWASGAASDFDRPLNKRGKKDAPRMGRWLRHQGLIPDFVVSSPAARARATALAVCAELGIAEEQVQWEPRLYEAGLGDLLKVLADCPEGALRVLLVGHNPGLENLLQYLTEAPDGQRLTTANVACLATGKDWKTLENGDARLLSLSTPKTLPADFR